jgi:hypothetical protein
MHKYAESGKRSTLIAPGFIMVCTGLSVIANYEDAATLRPEQYANVSLFTQPALLINPILISAPPMLVFVLILLVPSVLAQPRIKTAKEITAEAAVKAAQARANAKVRTAQVDGLADTVGTLVNRARAKVPKPQTPERAPAATKPKPKPPALEQWAGFDDQSTIPMPSAKVSHTHPIDD